MKSRPHLQRSLFQPPPDDRSTDADLARLDLTWSQVIAWRDQGLISFDPETVPSFERWMLQELTFIGGILRVEWSLTAIGHLLSSLPRPRAYDHASLAFEFSTGRWRRVYSAAQLLEAAAENHERALATVTALVRVLAYTDRRAELLRIRSLIDRLLADDLG